MKPNINKKVSIYKTFSRISGATAFISCFIGIIANWASIISFIEDRQEKETGVISQEYNGDDISATSNDNVLDSVENMEVKNDIVDAGKAAGGVKEIHETAKADKEVLPTENERTVFFQQ